MKNKNKLSTIAMMLIGIAATTNVLGQTRNNKYVPRWNSGSSWYEDASPVIYDDVTNSKIGIGTTSPSSLLTLDGNSTSTGNVFSSDGPNSVAQKWQMSKGGSLIGQIGTVGTSGTDFTFSTPSSQNIEFYTGSATYGYTRMFILSNLSGFNDGFIGIGPKGAFAPQSQLHQFSWDNNDVFHQFTNEYCHSFGSATPYDGLKIGITFNSSLNQDEAEFHYYEDASMKFFTGEYSSGSHAERVRITQAGLVGVNTTTPSNTVEINKGLVDYSGLTHYQYN